MDKEELKERIRPLIIQNKLKEVFDILFKETKEEEVKDELTILYARYNEMEKKIQLGTVDKTETGPERNSIMESLLGALSKRANGLEKKSGTSNLEAFRSNIELSLIQLNLFKILLENAEREEGLTMKLIMEYECFIKNHRRHIVPFLYELERFDLVIKERREKSTYWKINAGGVKFCKRLKIE